MKTPDPVVTVIAKSLPSFHPLVRYAERLGAADPVLAASELVVMGKWIPNVLIQAPGRIMRERWSK